MPRRIHIPDHLILPFGTATKNDLPRIKLSSVAANGVYFTSDVPCVYIDRGRKKPITIADYEVLTDVPRSERWEHEPDGKDPCDALDYVLSLIEKCMPNPTQYELAFVRHYFSWLKGPLKRLEQPLRVYNALLPIPEMQLYVEDPLEDGWTYEPSNNFRVDFGFWTGERLIAVEIDGNEPSGYARDIRRDRLLRRADIDVIHILNTEISKHGRKIISSLLPNEMLYGWRKLPPPKYSPLGLPF